MSTDKNSANKENLQENSTNINELMDENKAKTIEDENKDNSKTKVVVVKNYPMRNMVASVFSLLFLILASTIFSIPLLIFGKMGTAEALALTVVAELTVLVLVLKYVGQLKNFAKKLRLNNFKWKNVIGGLGLGFIMYFTLQGLAIGLEKIGMPIESSDTSVGITESTGWAYIVSAFVLVPIIVPFVEEMFFRGYVLGFAYDSFDKEKKPKQAIFWSLLISCVIFSLAHFQGFSSPTDIFLLIWIGLISLVNGILFLKTQSIYTSFALHMAYNGMTIIFPLLLA